MSEVNEILKKVYYDPKTGFLSAKKLYENVKSKGITMKQVKDFLNAQLTVQLTKKQGPLPKIGILAKPGSFQCDLTFYDTIKGSNKGYSCILCIVNNLSRKAYTYPLKNKSADSVLAAFKKFLEVVPKISELTSDNGVEFKNAKFAKLMKEHKISHRFGQKGSHTTMSMVESFNRTIRLYLDRYMAAQKTHNWVDALDDITESYNNSEHSAINKRPNDMTARDEFMVYVRARIAADDGIKLFESFKVGQKVRALKTRDTFEKGANKWSNKIYTIDSITGWSFILKDNDGELS